jgi:hypothetical protein
VSRDAAAGRLGNRHLAYWPGPESSRAASANRGCTRPLAVVHG